MPGYSRLPPTSTTALRTCRCYTDAMTLTRRRHTVDEFRKAFEAGVYAPDERLELLAGEVHVMTPIGRRHMDAVNGLNTLFHDHLVGKVVISVQNPLPLWSRSLPQPDLVLLHRRDHLYRGRDIHPTDVLLVVEVADSSLLTDRAIKLPLYADAGVPEVWIVNLQANTTEVYRAPAAGTYTDTNVFPFGTPFAPEIFPSHQEVWLED